jgi:hypothetical protein
MSLELLSTIGTLLTVLIVGATAIAALVQLRHLRAGNQINAILTIGDKFLEPKYQKARALVMAGLSASLDDPRFREYIILRALRKPMIGISEDQLSMLQAVNRVGNTFEEVGNLAKNDVIDERLFLDQYVTQVIATWAQLESYLALSREATGDIGLWDNFEYLTVRARLFIAEHPTTYPKGVARIQITNPWPNEIP